MDRLRGAAKTKLDEGVVFWLTMRRIGVHDNDVSGELQGSLHLNAHVQQLFIWQPHV